MGSTKPTTTTATRAVGVARMLLAAGVLAGCAGTHGFDFPVETDP